MSFESWDVGRTPTSLRALTSALAYAEEVEKGPRCWLFLQGAYGLGKTHLAIAILRRLAYERLWRPRVVVWPEHCSAVQRSWDDKNGPTETQLWGKMRDAAVLLIDDLDKRYWTWASSGHPPAIVISGKRNKYVMLALP
jgi:DNA replication protein DnaC